MNKPDILSKKWILHGRWIQAPLAGQWTQWYKAESVHELFPAIAFQQTLFLGGYTLSAVDDSDAVQKFLKELFLKGELGSFTKSLDAISSKYEKQHLTLLSDTHTSRNEYLLELFRTFAELLGIWSIGFLFPSLLEKIIRDGGFAQTDEEMLKHIKPFMRTTWLEQQTIEIKTLARTLLEKHRLPDMFPAALDAFESDPQLKEMLSKHVADFEWFGTHHWEGEPYTKEKALADIRRIIETDSFQEHRPHIEAIPAPSAHDDIWRLSAALMYWRTHCAEVTAKVVFHSRGKLTELASEWGLTYNELLYLTEEEVSHAIKNGRKIKLPENYAERKTAWGTIIENGKEKVVVGSELQTLIDAVVPKVKKDVSEVKGSVGNKGAPVHGKARIILQPSQFANFHAGEILIVNETTPDFVPLMKRAAAVVTDTGGITSHAAIVSRELGIPCVIGTKIATQVFKDGDMVEVDAEKGVVRKISL